MSDTNLVCKTVEVKVNIQSDYLYSLYSETLFFCIVFCVAFRNIFDIFLTNSLKLFGR